MPRKIIWLILSSSVFVSAVIGVSFYWYFYQNIKASRFYLAQAAINAQADASASWQSYLAQTGERHKGESVFYNLKDFIFDRLQESEEKIRPVAKIYFTASGIEEVSFEKQIVDVANGDRLDSSPNYQADASREIALDNNVSSRQAEADLDNDSIMESYSLKNGRLIISADSEIIWQSPAEWWIDDFVLADSNNDGIKDINLSLWKAGNFGSSKPFWVKENDMSVKNHFFVLTFMAGAVEPLWASSNLTEPNCEFQIADVDGDEKNDLVVIEGDYSQQPNCGRNYVAVWQWNGWGFFNHWRSEKGNFAGLEIEDVDGKINIVVNSF